MLLDQSAGRLETIDTGQVDVHQHKFRNQCRHELHTLFGRLRLSHELEAINHIDHESGRGPEGSLIIHQHNPNGSRSHWHALIIDPGAARNKPVFPHATVWFSSLVALREPENDGLDPLVDVLFEAEVELGEYGVDVLLDSPLREVEIVGNRGVCLPGCNVFEHLPFP